MTNVIDSRFFNSIEKFKQLKIKDRIFWVSGDNIRTIFFAGFNPMSENLVMFVDSHNHLLVHNIQIRHLVGINADRFVADYEFAKELMLANAENRVDVIKKIYFKKD